MDDLDEKIKKLMGECVFIDEKRKTKIKELLKNASPEAKKQLIEIFENTKRKFATAIEDFIKNQKEEAISTLNRLLTDGERIIRIEVENEDREKENQKADKLLAEI